MLRVFPFISYSYKPISNSVWYLGVFYLVMLSLSINGQNVSLTTLGTSYNQNFNTLSNTAGSTTNNLTITGWFLTESGGGARDNEQYAVDTGISNTGDTYSYGSTASTDRALGGLRSGTLIPIIGAAFTNNTGSTVTSLQISYTGEQWRLGTASRTDQLSFEYSTNATDLTTGTWTGVSALNFITPDITTTGAKDGNATGFRTALSATINSLSIPNGATFWIRWTDVDASGADDGLAIDDFSITPQAGSTPTSNLSINDVSLSEGNAGTTTFTFTVSLSAPAGAGGVTFDIATADGTATQPSDYTSKSLTGQTIPAGSSTYTFDVLVNGDATTEPNETFFVNVTNVTGATVTDGQGQGTIVNDDITLTPIHDIQGPGASSPIVGATITTRGIVTGVKNNGFFIQEPDASVDADPATSEGIFVFTSSAPPVAAAVGNLVQVTATVIEFVPSADPLQPPLTELSSPTTVQISTGNPLPTPVSLTTTFPDPAGPHDQLERIEGMRVAVASLTVGGPTMGNVNEPNATATSTGVFYGVVTGLSRPFREAGIQAPDPAPSGSGTIPPIPRFDANPERIRVDSDGLTGGPLLDVGTGAVVTGLIGPLDYTFRTYTILPDPSFSLSVSGGPTATAVTTPTESEFTVASYNLERFFDTVNDPGIGEPVLTAAAFDKRLNKASLGIRDYLKTPDIIGIVEIENLTTLQALATRINSDAVAASQPDPQYIAYLVEGNDVGGIDVGFLVKTSPVTGMTPRVSVTEVVQENAAETFLNPDNSTSLLNDRPALRLNAVINHPNGANYPITVIVNHLRSLNGANSETAGSNGWATDGARIRAKRQKQAESLANLVQARQMANPAERIILVGDFNAFEFNDGLGHSMGTIQGTPAPDNETAVAGDGTDLVNPDLTNLFNTAPPTEQYSFVFDGNAQSLDHVIVNDDVISSTLSRRVEHPRINADFPEITRNATGIARLADHDPIVSYYQVAAFMSADLSITKTDGVTTVVPGGSVTYTITASNAGPNNASGATVSDTFPASLTGITWTCVGAGGGTCTASGTGNINDMVNLPAGGSVTYTVSATVSASATGSLSNTATVAAPAGVTDPTPGNNSATDTDMLSPQADLSITKTDGVTTVVPGGSVTYTITASNAGPSNASGATVSDTFPASLTGITWTCVGAGGGTCSASGSGHINDMVNLPAGGSVTYTVSATVSASATGSLSNTATVAAPAGVTDPTPGNNSATDTDQIVCPPIVVMVGASNLCTGTTMQLSPTSGGSWMSSNPSIASVTDAGLVTGLSAGVVTFTFTLSGTGCSATTSDVTIKATPSSNLSASKTDVCPNTEVSLDAHCSLGGSVVNWNPGGSTVIPNAPDVAYTYKASCSLEGCTGNESSVEVRTHRILVDLKDVGLGMQPKALTGSIKDNLAPTNVISAVASPRLWTLVATGCSASESAVFKLTGPINFSSIDNNPPYALFANVGTTYFGEDHPNYGNGSSTFPNGSYNLVVDLRSADGVGGPFPKNRVSVGGLLATRSLQFTIGTGGTRQGIEVLSLNSLAELNWASIFQNPVSDEIVVRLSGTVGEEVSLGLVNLQGQTVQTRQLKLSSPQQYEVLNVGGQNAGMYILKAIKGDKVKTIKVVKAE